MVELSLTTEEKKKSDTIAAPLEEWGIHSFRDETYFGAVQDIKDTLTDYVSDQEIESLGLSPRRTLLLKMAMRKLVFVWTHGARGKGGERAKFYKAMGACRNIVLRVEEDVFCDATDDDVFLVGRDRLAQLDKIIMATFDSTTNTVQKSFVVHGPPQQNFDRRPEDRAASSNALSKIAQDQRKKREEAQTAETP